MTSPAAPRPRVLFVDDDPAFLRTVSELMGALSGGEWTVLTAEGASQAFMVLQDQAVDVAVVDMEMGVLDGLQMLPLLTRGHPNVLKVVLTGHASDQRRAACLASGAELFLVKPTTADGWRQVHAALKELLRFRPEQSFRGVLRRVELQEVIQTECLAGSSSVLDISHAEVQGEVFIHGGQIIHAQTGPWSGAEAFHRLLALRGGQFRFKPFVEPPARTLTGQWEGLLLEAARFRGEAEGGAAPCTAVAPVTGLAPAQMKVDTLPALHEVRAQPAPRAAAAPPRPEIAELLICSAQGDVLCEWQCRRPDLWIGLFEFISQKAQRLAHGLALGDFDRLELQTEEGRAVVIIGADRGVLVRTRQAPPVEVQTASARPGDRSAVAGWLRQAPAVRGALVRGVRFADQTFLCDVDSRDFPAAALEQGWRSVADTFQVLATHGFPPRRLAWHYQRAVLHCAQHADGTLFGAFAARKREEVDADGLERTLKAFAALAAAAP